MKTMIVLLFTLFMSTWANASNPQSLPKDLQALQKQATSFMGQSLTASELTIENGEDNVKVFADGLEKLGNNQLVEDILLRANNLKNSNQVLNFMNEVNNEFSINGVSVFSGTYANPIFSTSRCCFCGDCD